MGASTLSELDQEAVGEGRHRVVAGDDIVAFATVDRVGSGAADDDVVAALAVDRVASRRPGSDSEMTCWTMPPLKVAEPSSPMMTSSPSPPWMPSEPAPPRITSRPEPGG